MHGGWNIVVSGATSAGKTTCCNALARAVDASERIVTIEETAELRLDQPHVVRLEARPANAEGAGEVSVRELVRASLRMRPDRLVVGEVRGAEAFDMLQALNTGHDGSLSTVHANSPADALARLETLVLKGELDLTLIPQGTLAERIRAGGAGIPAFYVPTGLGTVVAEGKETRKIGDRTYVLEQALHADVALIKAWKGDRLGNLVYRKTARNFNPAMATAADLTIAEVEELVEPGELDPDHIVTPGIYVNRILVGAAYRKPIESEFIKAGLIRSGGAA